MDKAQATTLMIDVALKRKPHSKHAQLEALAVLEPVKAAAAKVASVKKPKSKKVL